MIQHLHTSRQIWEQRPKYQKHRHKKNKANPFCNTETDTLFLGGEAQHLYPLKSSYQSLMPWNKSSRGRLLASSGCLLSVQFRREPVKSFLQPQTMLSNSGRTGTLCPLRQCQNAKMQLQHCSLVVCNVSDISP